MASALALASVAEIAGVHLLLSRWSEVAAWIATAVGVWGLTWIVQDWRAVVRVPHAVDAEGVHVRRGKLWRADLPLHLVAEVRLPTPEENAAPSDAVDRFLWLPAAPWVVVSLSAPQALRGPSGIRVQVRSLGVPVDDPHGFVRAVEEARGAVEFVGHKPRDEG